MQTADFCGIAPTTFFVTSCQNYSALSRERWLLLTSNRLAVSSSSSCSSWFLTCDRRSHSLSFSFSSWDVQGKRTQPHLKQRRTFALSAPCFPGHTIFCFSVCAQPQSRLLYLLCSIQLFPEDFWPFFPDFQGRAAKPGELAMASDWRGPDLASSLHSGLWLWIQIYQPSQDHKK